MILYYTLTKYQQLAAMVHKLVYARDEEAHLYLSNGNHVETDYLDRLEKCNIFSAVKILNDQPAWAMGAKVNLKNEEELGPTLEKVFCLCESELLNNLEEYSDIYILADHFPLGFSLAYKNIPYHYIEEAVGVHGYYDLWLKKILEQKNYFLYLIGKNIGLYGNAPCVIDCYVDLEEQVDNYVNEKAVDFSVKKLLQKLDEQCINIILDIFGLIKFETNKDIVLILTEYMAGAKVCSLEEQHSLYGAFIDYFGNDGSIYIKPHPNDHQGMYTRWFPKCNVINKAAPSELIPYCIGNKNIKRLIAACSTSYKSLSSYADEVYSFRNKDIRFEKTFRYMNRYYAASYLINQLAHKRTVYGVGADAKQLEIFLKSFGNLDIEVVEIDSLRIPDEEYGRVVVIDSKDYLSNILEWDIYDFLNGLSEKDICIFIDSQRDVVFYQDNNYEWVKDIVPVGIETIPLNDNHYYLKEWIFVYTRDDKEKAYILQSQIDKMLVNAGVEIKVNSDKQTIRERVLEGMLYATERKCVQLLKRP